MNDSSKKHLEEVLQKASDRLFPAAIGEARVSLDSRSCDGDTPLHVFIWGNETENARTSEAHQFMTDPLLMRLIYPTLDSWIADEPSSVKPLRWLGLLRSDPDALRHALSLAPKDVPVRRRLINFALDDADYATHHLGESMLLSTVEETRESIAIARRWIASAPDTRPFADLSAEVDEYEQILDDWVAYNKSPVGTFPQWCEKKGRGYSFPSIVYYDDDSAQQDGCT